MQVKTCAAQIKAAGPHQDMPEGIVEAIVAAYNVDSVGDRIIPGAFKNTLARYKDAGRPIPFVWSHKSDDPDYHIGEVLEAEERPDGLWVKARIDLDEPKSAKVYKLLKGNRIADFSFAYEETDARPIAKSADGCTKELHELEIFECGPTMIGANRATSLLDIKSDLDGKPVRVSVDLPAKSDEADHQDDLASILMKAGWQPPVPPAVTAACDASEKAIDDLAVQVKAAPPGFTPKPVVARIRKLVAAAQALLDSVEPPKSDDSKAMPAGSAAALAEAKGREPVQHGAASPSRLRTDLALLMAEAGSFPTTSQEIPA